jgi:phosphatidylinositol phosphate synthase
MLGELKATIRKPLLPLAGWLNGMGIKPDHITFIGLGTSLLSGIALAFDSVALGLVWLLVALLCDMLDGDIARLNPASATPAGGFYDSCADRVSEALVFAGLLIGKINHDPSTSWVWIMIWSLALTGSFMVSYARARAEGMGQECKVGIAERPERMVLLVLLLIFGFGPSGWFLLAIAGLSWYTVYQRISHVARKMNGPASPEPESEPEQM